MSSPFHPFKNCANWSRRIRIVGVLFLLLAGFPIWSQGQTTIDSLFGQFVGRRIVVSSGDTIKDYITSAKVGKGVMECIGSFEVDSIELGYRYLSTYNETNCDRESFHVNKDSLIGAEEQGTVYFFGKDSILELVSLISPNGPVINEFRGVRDPNFQSISPPLTQVDFKVFPNPANNQVTIQFPEPGTLKVFNILGQVQVQLPFSGEQQLNVEHWSEGVYIVELEVEGAKIRQRVVVQ